MLDLDMAQYGPFVWSAWGISVLVLGALVIGVVGKARAAVKALRDLEDDAS